MLSFKNYQYAMFLAVALVFTCSFYLSSLYLKYSNQTDLVALFIPSPLSVLSNHNSVVNNASRVQQVIPLHVYDKSPLLVLCTTFKANESDTRVENTLREWASLSPRLHPVLYFTNDVGVHQARALGWTVVACPRRGDHISPSCVLPAMFLDAQKRFPTAWFYGYANGDLLFDKSLLTTLTHVEESLVARELSLLVSGCRFNYQMTKNESIFTASNVTSRRKKSAQFTGWAIDYFITPHGKYNWSSIPLVVVGRTGYDNFMISHSIGHNVTVLDATKTIFALHQTSMGNYESRKGKKDKGYNYKVMHRNTYNTSIGRVDCAQLISRLGTNNTMEFVKSDKCRKK